MVFFIPFAAWMDFRNYPHYYELGIFSEERWVEVMEGFHFRWAVQGLMAACFLFQFIILTWDKNGDRNVVLADNTACTALLLFWAILPLHTWQRMGAVGHCTDCLYRCRRTKLGKIL